MTDRECKKMELIAEVTVQRFFSHYLNEIFPEQLAAAITAHNKDVTAHTRQIKIAVQAESSRLRLWLAGLLISGGVGAGFGLNRLVSILSG